MRLLLDEHLPSQLARQLRARGVDCETLGTWRNGALLGADDRQILESAAGDDRILVTYDVGTIQSLLREFAELRMTHSGVIFVSSATTRQSNIGRLLHGLLELIEETTDQDWKDVSRFLRS